MLGRNAALALAVLAAGLAPSSAPPQVGGMRPPNTPVPDWKRSKGPPPPPLYGDSRQDRRRRARERKGEQG